MVGVRGFGHCALHSCSAFYDQVLVADGTSVCLFVHRDALPRLSNPLIGYSICRVLWQEIMALASERIWSGVVDDIRTKIIESQGLICLPSFIAGLN